MDSTAGKEMRISLAIKMKNLLYLDCSGEATTTAFVSDYFCLHRQANNENANAEFNGMMRLFP